MVSRARVLLIGAVAMAVVLGVETPSQACVRSGPPLPILGEIVFDAPNVIVDSTRLLLDCGAPGNCTVEARYRVKNGGSTRVMANALVMTQAFSPAVTRESPEGARPIRVSREEWVARAKRRPMVRAAQDEIEESVGSVATAWSFYLSLEGGEEAVVVVRGDYATGGRSALVAGGFDCVGPPLIRRHLTEADGQGPRARAFLYAFSPGKTPHPPSVVEIRVRHPREWTLVTASRTGVARSASREVAGVAIDDAVARAGAASDAHAWITLEAPGSAIWKGGPYFGAVWAFAPESGVRARLGYEIAAPVWLGHTLSVETDFRRAVTVVPATNLLRGPGFWSVGLGLPVAIKPALRVGGRAEGTMGLYGFGRWGGLALRAAFDLYPGMSGLPLGVEGSVGLEVSY